MKSLKDYWVKVVFQSRLSPAFYSNAHQRSWKEKFPFFFSKCFAIIALHLGPSLFNARLTLLSILCMTTVYSAAARWALPPIVCWHGGHAGCHRQAPCSTQQSSLEHVQSLARSQGRWLRGAGPFLAPWIQSLGLTQVWPPAASLEASEGLLWSCFMELSHLWWLESGTFLVVLWTGFITPGTASLPSKLRQWFPVLKSAPASWKRLWPLPEGSGALWEGWRWPWRWALPQGSWG